MLPSRVIQKMEFIVVYFENHAFENHAKQVNRVFGKNAEFPDLNLKVHKLSPRL
jgi:hypothetical protein